MTVWEVALIVLVVMAIIFLYPFVVAFWPDDSSEDATDDDDE